MATNSQPPEPDKRPTDAVRVPYWCATCDHRGECTAFPGERLWCGRCGSQYVTRTDAKKGNRA